MVFRYKQNPDKEFYDNITLKVQQNGGYCPCELIKTDETKCMCKAFKEQQTEGFCHCRRFYKFKGEATNHFKHWNLEITAERPKDCADEEDSDAK